MTPLAEKLHRTRKPITWACVLAWIAAFVATHISAPTASHVPGRDRTLHFVGYFALAGIFWLTLIAHRAPRRRRIAWVFVVLCLYGVFDELTQPLFNRTCSVFDWLANLVGITSLLIVAELWARHALRKENAGTL